MNDNDGYIRVIEQFPQVAYEILRVIAEIEK